MVRDQVSMEGVVKQRSAVLPAPLEQAQIDVQERCRAATASSSYATAQDTYGELNRVDSEGSPCSGSC